MLLILHCKRQEHLIQAAQRAFKYHTGKFLFHFLNMRLDYFSIFLQWDSLSLSDFGMHVIKIILMFSKASSKNVRYTCLLELVPLLLLPRGCRNVRASELKSSLHQWIAFIFNKHPKYNLQCPMYNKHYNKPALKLSHCPWSLTTEEPMTSSNPAPEMGCAVKPLLSETYLQSCLYAQPIQHAH